MKNKPKLSSESLCTSERFRFFKFINRFSASFDVDEDDDSDDEEEDDSDDEESDDSDEDDSDDEESDETVTF